MRCAFARSSARCHGTHFYHGSLLRHRGGGLSAIMKSVFRLAARRPGLFAEALLLGAAPVSKKRIGLTRPHVSRDHLRVMRAETCRGADGSMARMTRNAWSPSWLARSTHGETATTTAPPRPPRVWHGS